MPNVGTLSLNHSLKYEKSFPSIRANAIKPGALGEPVCNTRGEPNWAAISEARCDGEPRVALWATQHSREVSLPGAGNLREPSRRVADGGDVEAAASAAWRLVPGVCGGGGVAALDALRNLCPPSPPPHYLR